ncbi:MAG TPA: M1 family aminopeptidase [Allosphingosinicella sp.]|jgi:ABC-type transport system involved in multi-copper enzyme maturation permease subunit|uniref:ABC transporter permease/M1 family aminopeptidase n=1 Tax=Allosphingosinicella sp. TaxID=2823234 RepID=UPI002F292270
MLLKIAAFELRYQLRSPVFITVATFAFLIRFGGMSVESLSFGGGGNILQNSPYALSIAQLLTSIVFCFVAAAFVSVAFLRDDETAFGPIIRSSRIGKADYVLGRFLGAFTLGALVMAMLPLGSWLGTLMPTASSEAIGPNHFAAYAYAYGFFGLPNALIVSAILFAVAAWTRSAMGIYLSVIAIIALYLGSQFFFATRQLETARALADPFGVGAFQQAMSYATAAELNAGSIALTGPLLWGRLLWVGFALALLALTYSLFRFSEKGMSPRKVASFLIQQAEKQAPAHAAAGVTALVDLPMPRFEGRTARAQLAARARMEAQHIFRSPSFFVLLLIILSLTLMSLWFAENQFGQESYPLAALVIPQIHEVLGDFFPIIAIFFSGDLVWRERERRVHEIIDATPLPTWALMLSKVLGLMLVLLAVLLVISAGAILVQLVRGGVPLELGKHLLWYMLPGAADAVLIAVLAVFVQALSPNKYIGWGIMGLYLGALMFGGMLGLEHHLFVYGSIPAVLMSDMNGIGIYWEAAWWFRLFWAAMAALLLVAVHLLWPRGTDRKLKPQLRRLPMRLKGPAGITAAAAAAVLTASGAWILHNTAILNEYEISAEKARDLADYEKLFARYVTLPQPTVRHVELNVALHPSDIRLEAHGRYRIVNETARPIEQVHVRMVDSQSELAGVDLPGAQLERNHVASGYRIYRLSRPMLPGQSRDLLFHVRRQQIGFRTSGADQRLVPNGTNLNNFEVAPRIGMTRDNLLEDSAARRKHGLPAVSGLARLDDMSATARNRGNQSWITADITVSTSAEQTPIAPGKLVSDRIRDGRRTARFLSDTPILDFYSIQSARYAVRTVSHEGVQLAVYHHPAHHWNVERMLTAMRGALTYYRDAFGPYQFDQARIIERPAYGGGGQAFANTIAMSETLGFTTDHRGAPEIDVLTFGVAHELAHQWWAHQVIGAHMEGGDVVTETLAQYSGLMVMRKLSGGNSIRQFLRFQLNRYLTGRLLSGKEELPLARENEPHIVYGKGALVMYLLQERMGEDAVNRALRRFAQRFRFAGPPYPRSTDLIRLLRDEARTPEQQALITDIFERITIYDLRAGDPMAVRRTDGRWDVTVPVTARKYYADGKGNEREAPLNEQIEIGLFTAHPGAEAFNRSNVIRMERRPIRTGAQVLRFVTPVKPSHAGVDPYNFYIDREDDDNVGSVK